LLLQVLEQIMFRYVDLCVELKKGRYAKDGLIHYRNVCQQVNVSSLEEVIKYFLKTATNKAEAAQSKAAEVTFSSQAILLVLCHALLNFEVILGATKA
jgi:translation initiation factor 3 subunit A